VRLVDAVRRANRPGEPENSIALRAACAGTGLAGIAACFAEDELSLAVAFASAAAVVAGTVFSHLTRTHPRQFMKPVLAAGALLACVAFFRSLTSQAVYDVSGVEDPLAVLFAWIQGVHAFDTPARRDLVFTLAGSTTLMVVAAAQATDLGFAPYALCWAGLAVAGLCGMWSSQSRGGRASARQIAGSVSSTAAVAFAVLVALPAPHISGRVDFPQNGAGGALITAPGGLVGDGRAASEPARPGSPAGPTRVGGFLGFANRLDTALSPAVGDEVVMRVRAERPSYWIGETFDHFDGISWSTTDLPVSLPAGSPFVVPPSIGGALPTDAAPATSDLQTFYMVQSSPNLVFHADDADEVWFPVRNLFVRADDSLVSPISLGPGAIYTVQSEVAEPTAAELAGSWPAGYALRPATADALRADLELPGPDPRVAKLARAVTAHDRSTYEKVESLIGWIGAHTRYSTDIPPLPPGVGTVDEFLFGDRIGFCAQISSALAVMLRSLGVPAREAVGYVPGPYNPITDLYDIEAKDAHAWVQVWFPGFGWQSFDPTAVVPAANPAPGATIAHEAAHVLGAVPPLPAGAVLGGAGLGVALLRGWRRRPRSWAEAVTRRVERAGRRRRRPRGAGETLSEYARALDAGSADPAGHWSALADVVLAAAYGPTGPTPGLRADAERLLRLARSRHAPRTVGRSARLDWRSARGALSAGGRRGARRPRS